MEDERRGEWMVFGCLPGSKPQRLDRPQEPNRGKESLSKPWLFDEEIALHAPWVAYFEDFVRVDVGYLVVGVMNLRNGRFRHCEIGPWSSNGPFFKMTGIVVTKQGNVAWIGRQEEWPLHENEVFACEGTRRHRLAQGQGIALHSLRLHGPFVSWTNGSRTESARLK